MKTCGVPTGLSSLDNQLSAHGLPKGHVSAFVGPLGTGRLTLWSRLAARVHAESLKEWVAWIENEDDMEIHPPRLAQMGVDLKRFLIVRTPPQKRLWAVQEILQSRLFSLVGFDAQGIGGRISFFQKLTHTARAGGASVVAFFEEQNIPSGLHWLFPVRFNFSNPQGLLIERDFHTLAAPYFVRQAHQELNQGDAYAVAHSLPACSEFKSSKVKRSS